MRSSFNLVVKPKTVTSYLPRVNTVIDDFIKYVREENNNKNEFIINTFETMVSRLLLECIDDKIILILEILPTQHFFKLKC